MNIPALEHNITVYILYYVGYIWHKEYEVETVYRESTNQLAKTSVSGEI